MFSFFDRFEKEKMPSSNELPAKCMECTKSKMPRLHGKCRFCNELEFEESVLCDLNRCIQSRPDFDCHAFQPMLKLVSPLKNKVSGFNDGSTKEIKKNFISELLKSDFIPAGDFIDFINGIFLKCNDMVRGFASLLHLAPDHAHVYVESDGELSIEEMVHGMKRLSNKTIVDTFPLLRDKLGSNTEIWGEAYFVETIG